MATFEDMMKQIEVLRQEMIKVADINGRNHEKSIAVSRELDLLLNAYEREKKN